MHLLFVLDYRYVLRRILRRCVRYGTEKLNVPPGFIASLVSVAVDTLVSGWPFTWSHTSSVLSSSSFLSSSSLYALVAHRASHGYMLDSCITLIKSKSHCFVISLCLVSVLHQLRTRGAFPVQAKTCTCCRHGKLYNEDLQL